MTEKSLRGASFEEIPKTLFRLTGLNASRVTEFHCVQMPLTLVAGGCVFVDFLYSNESRKIL